ncbi:uncharacterized protein LOC124350823 isoform X4 [Daphnia pulicaria]|uniref:uncharacterized protein LOC124350823 isoform X4 n=1 Tax=Daphnia pulicaria TaxID=35523 RepID=UPI001EEBDFEF|nr:uncharacterized protein LOC124350823 isoform X4 [Daphnia pulicaria]
MPSNKRKVVYFFLLAATLSIIAVASANPVSLENAESLPNQDCFGWGRWGFATPNESSADEERQKRDENNFWYRAGMRTKLFFKNRFRG